MRELGYRTVDMLVERLTAPDFELLRRATPREMARRLDEPPPEDPEPYEDIVKRLEADVFPFAGRSDHPGYFAFIPAAGTWPGALGDLMASALNPYVGSWMESAGPSQLELTVLGWFKEWIGYPKEAAGILVSGGSAANMTALACAREALLGAMSDRVVTYVSDQSHSSLARAARVLGFRPDQVRVLPSDSRYRMRPDRLREAMAADRARGLEPLFVSASAGATNTGATDPLPELAEVCREARAWLHVDAAYGGFAVLTERGREALRGIELADSVTLDPHKWLYQPFECGSVLVREGALLRRAFEIAPHYLKDAVVEGEEVNFADLGVQLTRMARAFKLWVSLRYFGVRAFREVIDRCMDLALRAQERVEGSDELELLNPATLGIVCFRRHPRGVDDEVELEAVNSRMLREVEDSGLGLISSTRLRGRYALRLCVLSHTSTWEAIESVLRTVEEAPVARAEARAESFDRQPDVDESWLGAPRMDAGSVRRVPLFDGLTEEQAETVAASSRVVEVEAGRDVVAQWEATRDFYVILEGRCEVLVDGKRTAELAGGQFFGELAAMEWGADYSYPRLATVRATEPARLLVIPPGRFNRLLQESPGFAHRVEEAVRSRFPTV